MNWSKPASDSISGTTGVDPSQRCEVKAKHSTGEITLEGSK